MAEIVDTVSEDEFQRHREGIAEFINIRDRRELRNRFVVAIVSGAVGVRLAPGTPHSDIVRAAYDFADALVAEAERRDNPDGL